MEMINLGQHIRVLLRAIVCMIPALTLSGCVFEDEPEAGGKVKPGNLSNMIVLNISTVTPGSGTETSASVQEKIKTLRFIMLSDGYVEVNRRLSKRDFIDANDNVSDFRYVYRAPYKAGNKRFFFIANEEFIDISGTVQYEGLEASLSTLVNGKNLEEVLALPEFKEIAIPDEDGTTSDVTKTGSAYDLEKILNALYFAPRYPIYEKPFAEDDKINGDGGVLGEDSPNPKGYVYLPYAIYYSQSDLTQIKDPTDNAIITGLNGNIYLVPVATKFEFHFVNNREHEVEVRDLSVSQLQNENFLMPHVTKEDIRKKLPNDTTSLYWPDWLARVAELSWDTDYDTSGKFCSKYGWILKYDMPSTTINSLAPWRVRNKNSPTTGYWSVPGATKAADGKTQPGILDIGPYYKTETNYIPSGFTGLTTQRYGLNMILHDTSATGEGGDPVFDEKSTPIENLGSLFRDTHVVIRVVMNQGDTGVYGELQDWNRRDSWGFMGDYKK